MTRLRLTTNPGIEDVVEDEFRTRMATAGVHVPTVTQRPFDLHGQVLADTPHSFDEVFPITRDMRSIYHVNRQVCIFTLEDDAPLDSIENELLRLDIVEMETAGTFRVTTNRSGTHDFTSIDVQRVAGAALVEKYGTDVDLEEFDTNVRVDVFDDTCVVSVQHTREGLDKRHPLVYNPRVTLRTVVAYAMLHLIRVDTEQDGRLLDPFCGSGTILLEAAHVFPQFEVHGSDRFEDPVAGAQRNVAAAGLTDRIDIKQADARDLSDEYPAEYFDAIVTNPPYGVRLGERMNFYWLYRKFLEEAAAVLVPGGVVAILVKERGKFNGAVNDQDALHIRHVRIIETGGVYPGLFILERE